MQATSVPWQISQKLVLRVILLALPAMAAGTIATAPAVSAEQKIAKAAKPPAVPQNAVPAKDQSAVSVANVGSKPETKPGAKLETKPGAKPETKPGAKQETKPGAKPETKPGAKPETKPGAKPETKPGAMLETKPGAKPETKPAAKAEAKPEAKTYADKETGDLLEEARDLTHEYKYEEAGRLVEEAIRRQPKNPRLRMMLAKGLIEQGRLPKAIDELLEASLLDPSHNGPRFEIAQVYVYQGRFKDAVSVLQQIQSRAPFASRDARKAAQALASIDSALRVQNPYSLSYADPKIPCPGSAPISRSRWQSGLIPK